VSVCAHSKVFWLKLGGFLVGSTTSIQAFPEYKTIFEGRDKKFVINSRVFLDNIRNILFNSPKEDQFRVSLKLSNDGMSISTASCENEGIPIENVVDHSVHLDFNAYFLEACVKNLASDVFVLAYKDRFSPVVLSPFDGNDNTTIILATLK
jgi:DNA polymerase III sliding clamp (beta) subunit (PCNA family)